MKLAVSARFELRTNVRVGVDDVMLPVQLVNTWPELGRALRVYFVPTVNVCPVRSGQIFPLPAVWRMTVGGGFERVRTFNRNVVVDVAVPSLTAIIMSAFPVCPEEGASVTVRLLSVPLKKMFVFETSDGLDELAE